MIILEENNQSYKNSCTNYILRENTPLKAMSSSNHDVQPAFRLCNHKVE